MKFTLEIEINAPQKKVFEMLIDYDHLTKWYSTCKSVKHESGKKGEEGASYKIIMSSAGGETDVKETVIILRDPECFITQQENSISRAENRHYFSKIGNGKTKWTWEWSMKLHNPLHDLSASITGFFIGGTVKKPIMQAMKSFKKLVESTP